jgi:hypothetical protein
MPSIRLCRQVVELRLGHAVVDVDRRELERVRARHLIQPVHAGRGLLGDTLDAGHDGGVLARVVGEGVAQPVENDLPLIGVRVAGGRNPAGLLVLGALVHEEGGVTAVVQDHVRGLTVRPGEGLLGAPPVLFERLALPGEDGHALRVIRGAVGADGDGRRGVVLGGENVAARPAYAGAQRRERLDEDRGLDRHVQRASDPGPLERLLLRVLLADRHQAGHLVLGELDLLAAEAGQAQIGDPILFGAH